MRAIIFTNPLPKDINKLYVPENNDFLIGVDGALEDLNLIVDVAVGDFDSIKNIDNIKAKEIIKLPKDKDVTDTKKALEIASQKGVSKIIIYGGIKGPRPEHFIANINSLIEFDNAEIVDENTHIIMLKHGVYEFNNKDCYYSFFATEETIITLSGFKFELDEYMLSIGDSLAISNELNSDVCYVIIDFGKVLLFKSLINENK